jgi:hypothetical protein
LDEDGNDQTGERLSQFFIDSEEDGSILDEYESDSFIVSDNDEISIAEASNECDYESSSDESSEVEKRRRRRGGRKRRQVRAQGDSLKRNRKNVLDSESSSEHEKDRRRCGF